MRATHCASNWPTLELLDLVHERCQLPELEFIFRHALTQEVAYQTLLTPARKELHRKWAKLWNRFFEIALKSSPACLLIIFSQRSRGRRLWTTRFDLAMLPSGCALMPRREAITGGPWNASSTSGMTRSIFGRKSRLPSTLSALRSKRTCRRRILPCFVEAEQIAQLLERSGRSRTHPVMDRPGALLRRQAKGSRRLLSKSSLFAPATGGS